MTFRTIATKAALVAAFFLSSVQAQIAPDYIRHPASLPCASNTYVQTLGSTSGTQATCATIPDAVADGSTKGIAAFGSADFNSTTGVISIDYTNGQKASGSQSGFLSSTDWTTFNNKGSGTVTTTGSPTSGNLANFSGTTSIAPGDLSGDVTTSGTLATTIANNAITTAKINANAVTLAKLATQSDKTLLANISGGAAVPTASGLSAIIANILGNGTSGQAIVGDGAGNFSLGTVGGGSGGALTYITSATVTGSAVTTVSISGLNLSTDGCYLIFANWLNKTGSGTGLSLYMNSDTTAGNYRRVNGTMGPSSVGASQVSNPIILPSSSFVASFTNAVGILTTSPGGTYVIYQFWASANGGGSPPAPNQVAFNSVAWSTASINVTGLIFSGAAGEIDVGSHFEIFRIRQ